MHIQEGKKIFLTVLTLSQQGKKKQTRKSPKITKEEGSTIKQHLYLDSFNQVSSAVCNFLGRLHEVSLGNRICCFWWSNATSVAQSRRVFGHDRGSWQDLQKPAQNRHNVRGAGQQPHCSSATSVPKARQQSQTTTPLTGHEQSKVPCPDRDGPLQSSAITCDGLLAGSTRFWHAIWIAWLARANWIGSTRPCWPAWLFGSEIPTR